MIEEYALGHEMDAKERYLFENTPSKVKKVPKITGSKPPKDQEAIIEGLLYIVGEDGLRIEQLAMALDISYEEAKKSLERLAMRYAKGDHGIELVDYGGHYKFLTKIDIHPYAQRLLDIAKTSTLSQSALETLAIIAYKQPITRVEIEDLRGVGSDMMLRKLQARNLIREAGRSEAPGRPILYEVTEEFMDSFKLTSLSDLPELPEYSSDEESEDLFQR